MRVSRPEAVIAAVLPRAQEGDAALAELFFELPDLLAELGELGLGGTPFLDLALQAGEGRFAGEDLVLDRLHHVVEADAAGDGGGEQGGDPLAHAAADGGQRLRQPPGVGGGAAADGVGLGWADW